MPTAKQIAASTRTGTTTLAGGPGLRARTGAAATGAAAAAATGGTGIGGTGAGLGTSVLVGGCAGAASG